MTSHGASEHASSKRPSTPNSCHCEEHQRRGNLEIEAPISANPVLGRSYTVYILSNARRTVLYTGVTNDLNRRLTEHRSGTADGFTKRYNVHELVYAETYDNVNDAIAREKQIKSWSRKKKDELVASFNPELRDLTGEMGW